MKKLKAIYAGTFDPITLGHLDIITRASKIFHHIIIAIYYNNTKNPLFSLDMRINLARKVTSHLLNVEVLGFNKLITDLAVTKKVNILIRGLRNILDFEHELHMMKINKYLSPNLENVFLMSSEKFSFISSSSVKKIAIHGGDVKNMLPELVYQALLSIIN